MILKKLFGFDPSVMKVKTEVMAGITTFLTMSYILAVNPDILSAASMDRGAVFTATALAASIATLLMAILAKLPFALAPGMGSCHICFFGRVYSINVVGRGWNYYRRSVGCPESERGSFLRDCGGHVVKYSFGDNPDTGRLFFSIDASFSGTGLFQIGFSFFVVPEYVDCDFLARVHGYF